MQWLNEDTQKVAAVSNHSVLFLPLVPGPGSSGARTTASVVIPLSAFTPILLVVVVGGGGGGSVVSEDNQNPSSLVSLAMTGWSLQGIMLSSEGVELKTATASILGG